MINYPANLISANSNLEKDKGDETGPSSENPGKKSGKNPDNEFERESRVAEQQKSAEKETEVSSGNSRSS